MGAEGRHVTDHELAEALRDFTASRVAVADAVDVVREQREDDRRKAKRDRKVALAIAAVFVAGGVVVGYRVFHQPSSQTARRIEHIVNRLDTALDPHGCTATRGQAQTALLILGLENDNRVIHHADALPTPAKVAEDATKVCPGDPKPAG